MSNLYQKYTVSKTDGEPIDPDARYFVLRIDTDPAARRALQAYISNIRVRDPEFAKQLADWLGTTPLLERGQAGKE